MYSSCITSSLDTGPPQRGQANFCRLRIGMAIGVGLRLPSLSVFGEHSGFDIVADRFFDEGNGRLGSVGLRTASCGRLFAETFRGFFVEFFEPVIFPVRPLNVVWIVVVQDTGTDDRPSKPSPLGWG